MADRRALALLLLVGCADDPAPKAVTPTAPVHALEAAPYTTLQQVWEPLEPPQATRQAMDEGSLSVHDLGRFDAAGLGVRRAEGVPWIEYPQLAPGFVEGAAGERRSVAWIWVCADPQVIDEESPVRFEGLDAIYRPQGHLMSQTLEAHVRTAEAMAAAAGRPFDFALLPGDLTDGSHENELDWFLTALVGGEIDPDSGVDDDPIPGPGNDYNDPFWSDGLHAPWYATLGNHDGLYNGGFGHITEEIIEAAVGGEVYAYGMLRNGFRDGSTEHAALVTEGSTPADPRRRPLRHGELLERLHDAGGAPPGHGLTAADVDEGRGWFSAHPIPNVPLRLISLDTSFHHAEGPAAGVEGFVGEDQHTWLRHELAAADAAGELVIVMSHHRTRDFASKSEVSGEVVAETLAASRGVVLHLTGHGHRNRAHLIGGPPESPTADSGHWELMTASTIDFPIQSRIIELVDEGNGFLSIYATNVDHNSPPGSLAHRARELAAAKVAFGGLQTDGDVTAFWATEARNLNLLLRIRLAADVAASLAATKLPAEVESEVSLRALAQ